jgi:hypothetical protein
MVIQFKLELEEIDIDELSHIVEYGKSINELDEETFLEELLGLLIEVHTDTIPYELKDDLGNTLFMILYDSDEVDSYLTNKLFIMVSEFVDRFFNTIAIKSLIYDLQSIIKDSNIRIAYSNIKFIKDQFFISMHTEEVNE